MYEQCFQQIKKAMVNWSTMDVRTVPGVMFQIRCGDDDNDLNIEYQINWFQDCTETFIHNHRNSFDSLCLEGEYREKLWEIIDDNTGAITYQFCGKSGSILGAPNKISGTLCHVKSRRHYPGNILHVDTDQYHSIVPKGSSDGQVFTFLAKKKHLTTANMYILSSIPTADAPSNEMRPASEAERQKVYDKLQYILRTKFPVVNSRSSEKSVNQLCY